MDLGGKFTCVLIMAMKENTQIPRGVVIAVTGPNI